MSVNLVNIGRELKFPEREDFGKSRAVAMWRAMDAVEGSQYLADITGNGHDARFGSTTTADTNDPQILPHTTEDYLHLPGAGNNNVFTENVNLLDTAQANFDNSPFTGTVRPEDRYEVWGSGGATGPGTPGNSSPMLIDIDKYQNPNLRTNPNFAAISHNTNGTLISDQDQVDVTSPTGRSSRLRLQNATTFGWGALINGGGYTLRVRKGDKVHVGFWVKLGPTNTGNGIVQSITLMTSSAQNNVTGNSLVVGGSRGPYTATTDWQYCHAVFDALTDDPLSGSIVYISLHAGSYQNAVLDVYVAGVTVQKAVTKAGWLPGSISNYFSTPDVNLLRAREAHVTEVGSWLRISGTQYDAATVELDTQAGQFGPNALKATLTSSNQGSLRVATSSGGGSALNHVTVNPSTSYGISARVKAPTGTSLQIFLECFRSDNSWQLSPLAQTLIATGDWQTIGGVVTTPSEAARAHLMISMTANGSSSYVAGSSLMIDSAIVRQGTSAEFVPSHRITGDLDLRVRLELKSTRTFQELLAKDQAGDPLRSYVLRLSSGGLPSLAWHTDGTLASHIAATSTVPLPVERMTRWIRATLDVDNGSGGRTIRFFTSEDGASWTQLGADVVQSGVTSIAPTSAPVSYGVRGTTVAPITGSLLEAEVRDGIDGPIVSRFDAEKFTAGAGNNATYTDAFTGNEVRLHQNGDVTTEIVDRNTWAFAGSTGEHLSITSRTELNFAASRSFELAANAFTRAATTTRRLLGKRGGGHGGGYEVNVSGASTQFSIIRSASVVSAPPKVLVQGQWNRVFASRDVNNLTTYANGNDSPTAIVDATPETMENNHHLTIGRMSSAADLESHRYVGLNGWTVLFRRALTTAERSELAAWNGKVATEPSWLRSLAVFYTNADDPFVRSYYENNEVLNLASKPYGQLGWSPDGPYTTVRRWENFSAGAGSILRVPRVKDGLGYLLNVGAVSSLVGPVTAGETYTGSVNAQYWPNASSGRTGRAQLVWFDTAGGEVGRSDFGAHVLIGSNSGWQRVSVTAVAPTGATRVALRVVVTNGGLTDTFNHDLLIDAATIRQGSEVTYMPSINVRHQLETIVTLEHSTMRPESSQVLISNWNDTILQRHFILWITSDGGLACIMIDENGGRHDAYGGTLPASLAGKKIQVRVTVDPSIPQAKFYYREGTSEDWTLRTTTTPPGGAFRYGLGRTIKIGAYNASSLPFEGKIYDAELRDGLGGPVVVRFNPASCNDERYTSWTDQTGRTWNVSRSLTGRKAVIVDRPLLLFGTDDFLEVPHHADFIPPTGSPFTVMIVLRDHASAPTNFPRYIAKGMGAWGTVDQWSIARSTIENTSVFNWFSATRYSMGTFKRSETVTLAMVVDGTDVEGFQNSISLGGAALGVYPTNTHPVRIGATSPTLGGTADMEFLGAAVFRGRLTPLEIEWSTREIMRRR